MTKKKTPLEVEFLWGLPGSGKTTYVGESNEKRIDLDQMIRTYQRYSAQYGGYSPDYFLGVLAGEIAHKYQYGKTSFVLDGLITTNEFALKILETLRTHSNLKQVETAVFRITYWKEDRESCLWNDQGRRLLSSDQTIKNMPFEIPDPEILKIPAENIVAKNVVRKSHWVHLLNEKGAYTEDGSKLTGARWTTGGRWGDCWGGEGSINPDPAREFVEFDELIEKLVPHISFLQYKRIFRECCSQKADYSSGNYGGYTHHAFWECDLQKLRSVLKEMDLIVQEM